MSMFVNVKAQVHLATRRPYKDLVDHASKPRSGCDTDNRSFHVNKRNFVAPTCDWSLACYRSCGRVSFACGSGTRKPRSVCDLGLVGDLEGGHNSRKKVREMVMGSHRSWDH